MNREESHTYWSERQRNGILRSTIQWGTLRAPRCPSRLCFDQSGLAFWVPVCPSLPFHYWLYLKIWLCLIPRQTFPATLRLSRRTPPSRIANAIEMRCRFSLRQHNSSDKSRLSSAKWLSRRPRRRRGSWTPPPPCWTRPLPAACPRASAVALQTDYSPRLDLSGASPSSVHLLPRPASGKQRETSDRRSIYARSLSSPAVTPAHTHTHKEKS